MDNLYGKLVRLIKKLPEDRVAEVAELVEKIIDESKSSEVPECPHCGAPNTLVVKYGSNGSRQRYRCNKCRKHFSGATKSALESSRYGEAVWKQAIRDTIGGVSLDKTAASLEMTHATAFNMRHKILSALETAEGLEPTVLNGACEIDDTYVLESVKGKKIPEGYWRGPRKHGAKASKPGISNEQVSIMAGVSREGKIYTKTLNRATPSKEVVFQIFEGRIGRSALILCDGAKSIKALGSVAEVGEAKGGKGGFYHMNHANGYHSYIKRRQNNVSHGVATKYQNRYNALYSSAYGCDAEELTEAIYNMLIDSSGNFRKNIAEVKTLGILDLGQLIN